MLRDCTGEGAHKRTTAQTDGRTTHAQSLCGLACRTDGTERLWTSNCVRGVGEGVGCGGASAGCAPNKCWGRPKGARRGAPGVCVGGALSHACFINHWRTAHSKHSVR